VGCYGANKKASTCSTVAFTNNFNNQFAGRRPQSLMFPGKPNLTMQEDDSST